jgi:proline iminopeptidase
MMAGMHSPPKPRERSIDRGRSRLFIREVGAGHPLIVVHGGPDFDHRYLLPELDVLAAHAHLVYYDQRGRGSSYSGERGTDITLEGEMSDMDAVREAVGAPTAALLGHSFGTLLAAEYAIRHPDRVSHLILLNPAPMSRAGLQVLRPAIRARRTPEELARMQELAADPAFLRGELEPELEYNRIHFRSTVRDPDLLADLVRRMRSASSADGIVATRGIEHALYEQTWARESYDLLPALGRLSIPTLVVSSDNDFIPASIGAEIAAALPNGRLVTLEDCGHFSFLEHPEAVRRLVAGLLTGSPAGNDRAIGRCSARGRGSTSRFPG